MHNCLRKITLYATRLKETIACIHLTLKTFNEIVETIGNSWNIVLFLDMWKNASGVPELYDCLIK